MKRIDLCERYNGVKRMEKREDMKQKLIMARREHIKRMMKQK